MQEIGMRQEYPELKELVLEASRSLARLDADRLEELALSCQALNRELTPMSPAQRVSLARQSRAALGDMATFARVLEATRANLNVMNRLRALRAGRRDYTDRDVRAPAGEEILRGND
jgi:aminopeptidase N